MRGRRSPAKLATMTEHFERHRQPWTPSEIQKLHTMATKGMSLKAICTSLKRSEESVKIRAKLDKLLIAKKR
jgi:DNA-binding NarL/FixJ family response regulator